MHIWAGSYIKSDKKFHLNQVLRSLIGQQSCSPWSPTVLNHQVCQPKNNSSVQDFIFYFQLLPVSLLICCPIHLRKLSEGKKPQFSSLSLCPWNCSASNWPHFPPLATTTSALALSWSHGLSHQKVSASCENKMIQVFSLNGGTYLRKQHLRRNLYQLRKYGHSGFQFPQHYTGRIPLG